MTRQELLERLGLAHLADRPDDLVYVLEEALRRGEGPPPALDPDTAFRVRLALHVLRNPPEPGPPSPTPEPGTTDPGPRLKEHHLKPPWIVGNWKDMAGFEPKLPALEERS